MGVDGDHGAVSEIALCSATLAQFERELIAYLQPILGFDTACTVWSDHEGGVRHVTALEYREARLQRDFPRFMSELSPEELLAFASAEPVLDTHVLAQQRRSRLAVYRELLVPFGVSQFVTNVYHSRFGVFGFHFGRAGALRTFKARELRDLNRVLPVMKLAQALLAAEALGPPRGDEWWVDVWRLSPRERELARLVGRGMQNAEIARLLGMSTNTVRNHLVSIFHKACVSTRAELVFAMMSETPIGPGRVRPSGARRPWSAPLAELPGFGSRTR
jgi:DNA-binding CsgD family transcriptional regulator